jgi:hypothetical protein
MTNNEQIRVFLFGKVPLILLTPCYTIFGETTPEKSQDCNLRDNASV